MFRGLAAAVGLVLAGCTTGGPPALGPAFYDATQFEGVRPGRLIESPIWIDGPDNIDFALFARRRIDNMRRAGVDVTGPPSGREPIALECRVNDAARLTACLPLGNVWSTPERRGNLIGALTFAYEMRMEPLDATGTPVAGGRVRFNVQPPDIWPEPSDDVFVPPALVAQPPPHAFTAYYPDEALRADIEADVVLACVVSETGVNEGCDVIYESVSQLGFGEASRTIYSRIAVRPGSVNGQPRRGVVVAPVYWRLG